MSDDDSFVKRRAQQRKADEIAAVLRAAGVTAQVAADLDDDGRSAAAGLTGRSVRCPSEVTWSLVLDRLK